MEREETTALAAQEDKRRCDTGDAVHHPSHYNQGTIEVIDFIYDQRLNFSLGNAIKYICRAGRKGDDAIQDLEKAKEYITFEIEHLAGFR